MSSPQPTTGPGRDGRRREGQDGLVPLIQLPVPPRQEAEPATAPPRVQDAVAAAGWPGIALPATRVLGVWAYPVVAILPAAAERQALEQGPETDGRTLELWEQWPADLGNLPPQPPLQVVGFVTEAGTAHALSRVVSLRGLGAGMVLARRSTRWQAWEADVASVWLVADGHGQPQVIVHGRRGPAHTARRRPGTRLVEERLFGHAIAVGALTSPPGRV